MAARVLTVLVRVVMTLGIAATMLVILPSLYYSVRTDQYVPTLIIVGVTGLFWLITWTFVTWFLRTVTRPKPETTTAIARCH